MRDETGAKVKLYDPNGVGYTRATLIENSGKLFCKIEQIP